MVIRMASAACTRVPVKIASRGGRRRCGHKERVVFRVRRMCTRLPRAVNCSPPSWNPQNVPDPQVMPSPNLTPEDCVEAQLQALKSNDEPWANHGIQTMYAFAEDAGGMERSRYFGFSKDLYHFDHFLGGFFTAFPELVNLATFQVGEAEDSSDGMKEVSVKAVSSVGSGTEVNLLFRLVVRNIGRKKGCWMTKSIVRKD